MNHQTQDSTLQPTTSTRRQLSGVFAGAAATIVPRHVLGGPGYVPPSDKLNIACVGVNGKGYSDIAGVATENIVALCDVDDVLMADAIKWAKKDNLPHFEMMERASKYRDFRKMLDTEKSIDAITVSTPDHTHAIIALTAMRMGKHAFVQKPLTCTVQEARLLAQVAKEMKLVTQMGNQGHASEEARMINEWIADGAIGEITEVHTWTDRPIWPQGIARPLETPALPSTLDWDLWLGPAPFRPYHPAYAPFNWRGWWDFGTGALGDMGAHIIDHPYWALNLGLPETIQASSTEFNDETFPLASTVHYTFPAREKMPAVKMTWYDGGLLPFRPEEIEESRRLGNQSGGVIFVGSKGKLMCGILAESPRLIPETKMKAYKLPPKTLPRSPGIYEEWIAAIKSGNGAQTTSNFEYAAQLTETMLLGNIAIRLADKNLALKYDGRKMAFTNMPEANRHLTREYRAGWNVVS
ncbi:gfo/Idh/MocA family oxidoreductase [candidate division KSB1 bacterium]|nr:gfo/Idh/MocA family oxidoreductase [candidate division KSB1 bacterium]MDL1879144.1 Gfo/Idh/MocA family oxidoreductase [Cytophagia bacterium CHB2]